MFSGPHMMGFGQHATILTYCCTYCLWVTNLRHFEGLRRASDEGFDSMKLPLLYQIT